MLKLKRLLWLFVAALSLGTGTAFADYPSKTVRLISGVTPGSASDTMARILAEKMAGSLGQPVIVENWLGAGGLVGASRVAKAEPDGHVIMVYASAFTVSPLLNRGVLDPKDLTPVATIATIPTVLVVKGDGPYKSVADLVAAAKAKPGAVVATSAGVGSATHMNLERFRISAGIEVLHVPLKGAPEAFTEVLTGRADFYFALPFQARSQAGKVRALAVGSPKRSGLFPDVPTTVEAGYADSDYNFWVGALMSAKTPPEIVQRLHREFNAAVNAPDVHARIVKTGADPLSLTLPQFQAMIDAEFAANAKLIERAGIKPNN